MDEWTPVLALPNLDMRGTLECDYAAIVAPTDPRIEKLRVAHPKLTTFLSKFSGQFRERVWPSLLLLHADAPRSYYTAEAVSALRDVLSLSVVPYARTTRLRFDRANGLAFTNIFQFYPWMLNKQFEGMVLINPAQVHSHLLKEFKGQSFPEQPQASIMWNNIDVPLARELLSRWIKRFSDNPLAWKDKALFRSLNPSRISATASAPAPCATSAPPRKTRESICKLRRCSAATISAACTRCKTMPGSRRNWCNTVAWRSVMPRVNGWPSRSASANASVPLASD